MTLTTAFRPTRKRLAALGAVAGAAALALAVTAPADATAGHHAAGHKPTVVLVHGAFVDGSSWNDVIKRLQHEGYPVIAPADPLRGLASDAAYINSVLKSIKGPVVLVGHSYGGSVISQAAAGEANVKALVYIAAFAQDKGESVSELNSKFPASDLGSALNAVPYPLPGGGFGTDLYVKADTFHRVFAADVPKPVTDLAAATQRPVSASVFDEKPTEAAWKTIPSWDLITTQDHAINPDEQRFMAQRAHAHTTEIDSSHAVPLSHPDAVTRIIEQAAHTTAH
ncbi:alpha/beta hydrolase [Streptomyces sp. NPDC046900]|uniref:alpha/beta fold hydrolase n=1 Tax=Streptomyces sp. NPDC046900 TaxID=3155473 RepID=UPI0034074700